MAEENRIDELIKKLEELKRKAEELRKRLEERKKPEKKTELKDILKKLEMEYKAYLNERGVINTRECIEYVKEDIESLAEAVVEGKLSLNEALHRVRKIGVPPIARLRRMPTIERPLEEEEFVAPPAEEREFVTAKEAAEIIYSKYLPHLLLYGLNWVFENYGRDFGMTKGMLGKTAWYLANKIKKLGKKLIGEGHTLKKGRLILVGDVLRLYPFEIVWQGIRKPVATHIANIYNSMRETEGWRELLNVLENVYDEEGHKIKNSVSVAFIGVLLRYLGAPEELWPPDIRICYNRLEEIAPDP